jgi:glycosyltransferase involved in cell wall biosynthesis
MKKYQKRLLVINQVMDLNHSALSHQIDVVTALSNHFEYLHVLTGHIGGDLSHNGSNVTVSSFRTSGGLRVIDLLSFYFSFFKLLFQFRPQAIFCHMATVESMLISSITKALGIKHVLWYAHKALPWQLRVTSKFIDNIVTSTKGSCPLKGSKVKVIGQGIDLKKFCSERSNFSTPKELVYVGRLDSSKGIREVVQVANQLSVFYGELDLELLGAPLRPESKEYLLDILTNLPIVPGLRMRFSEPLSRDKLQRFYISKDLFLHAYQGSLDKVLIEATLAGLPVVTLNEEFNRSFFVPPQLSTGTLFERAMWWFDAKPADREVIMQERWNIAKKQHSLESWTKRLSQVIESNRT